MIKFIYSFLMVFGALGLMICPLIAYYASSTISAVKADTAQIREQLSEIRTIVEYASISLQKAESHLSELSTNLKLAKQATLEVELTVKTLLMNINEVAHTIDSANETLYEIADMLDAISKNFWIRLFASDVAKEAGEAASSMKRTADNIERFKPSLSVIQDHLKAAEGYVADVIKLIESWINRLKSLSDSITTWIRTLQTLPQYVDYWIGRVKLIDDKLWVVEYVTYGLVGYIGMIHVTFILIGMALKHLRSEIKRLEERAR